MTHPGTSSIQGAAFRGLPHWYRNGARRMPLRLDSIYAPVRILGDVRTPGGGSAQRVVGTGFFVTVGSETLPSRSVRYAHLVTADHIVVKHGPDLAIQIANPWAEGQVTEPIPIDGRDWMRPLPEMDLAVLPWFQLAPDPLPPLMAVGIEDQFLRDRTHLRHGSTVYYIGLLASQDRIMVRTGNIGALDQHGMDLEGGYKQPVHLLDCRSYRGFSGSPCFVEVTYAGLRPVKPPQAYPKDRGELGELESFAFLVGMLTNHLDAPDEDGAASRYGVGVMLPFDQIEEALMSDELRDARRKADEAKNDDEPKFEGISAGDGPDEFRRFDDLARKLAKVPKSEVDELRKKKK